MECRFFKKKNAWIFSGHEDSALKRIHFALIFSVGPDNYHKKKRFVTMKIDGIMRIRKLTKFR